MIDDDDATIDDNDATIDDGDAPIDDDNATIDDANARTARGIGQYAPTCMTPRHAPTVHHACIYTHSSDPSEDCEGNL